MSDDLAYRIGKMRLAPGDVLVVKVDCNLNVDTGRRVREYVAGHVSSGTNILVIGDGIDLAVLTREEIETRLVDTSRRIGDAIASSRKAQTRYP